MSPRAPALVLVLLAGLAGSGCTAAGLVAAPVLSSMVAIGDRSVTRTLPADRDSAWSATLETLGRLGIRVDDTDRSGERWRLVGTAGALSVHGALERVTAGMSRLSLRAETGGLLADRRTAEEILAQVGAALGARAAGASSAPASAGETSREQLAALRREIERLGARLDDVRRTGRSEGGVVPADDPGPESGVVLVPLSAGVPTLGVSRAAPPPRPTAEAVGNEPPPPRGRGPERDGVTARIPAPLGAADVLAPVDRLGAVTLDR